MFKLTGTKHGSEVAVTWDNGAIDNDGAKKHLLDRLVEIAPTTEGGKWMAPGCMECVASLSDSVFCYVILSEWFDEVTDVEGETGWVSEPGVVY